MDGLWITVTHARLRARQGDLSGAQRVIDAVLARRPADAEALRFRAELERGMAPAVPARLPDPAVDPARVALAAELAERVRREFRKAEDPRVVRLDRWLYGIERSGRSFLASTRPAPTRL